MTEENRLREQLSKIHDRVIAKVALKDMLHLSKEAFKEELRPLFRAEFASLSFEELVEMNCQYSIENAWFGFTKGIEIAGNGIRN